MKKHLLWVAAILAAACTAKPEPALLDDSKFVTEVDGKPVSLVTIKGGRLALQATNFGGRVVSLFVPDKDGNYKDVVLGHETIDEYVHYTKERFLGACVGPVANRITGASFTVDGNTYQLDANHGGKGTLHGGFKGLDSVVWDIAETEENSVTFHYLHKDGEGGFPGNLDIKMKYSLTDDDSFKIEYEATTDKTRPVNISNHPYFNFSQDGTIDNYVMYINGDSITGIEGLDVLDPPINILGTPMDYKAPHRVGDAFGSDFEQLRRGKGFDHNYCINVAAEGLTLAASAYDPASGIFLEVLSDQPGLQVYSGQYFNGEENGKYGSKLLYHGSLTFETQNWPDAPNKPSFPDPYLRPGQTYKHTCIYHFSVK